MILTEILRAASFYQNQRKNHRLAEISLQNQPTKPFWQMAWHYPNIRPWIYIALLNQKSYEPKIVVNHLG
jgi:hypothetical protein